MNLLYHPTPKLGVMLGANLSQSKASFDPIQMPNVNSEVTDAIEIGYYDYSMIHNYSDLEYSFMNLSLGAEYQVNKSFALTLDVDYYNLKDSQAYVYGDETGSFYIVKTGFRLGNFGF